MLQTHNARREFGKPFSEYPTHASVFDDFSIVNPIRKVLRIVEVV